MGREPYAAGLLRECPYRSKREVTGTVVAVVPRGAGRQALRLMIPWARCVCRGQIHELLAATTPDIRPGQAVEDAFSLGLVEIKQGGVIIRGDEVRSGHKKLGTLAGFGVGDSPDHLKIALNTDVSVAGGRSRPGVGERVVFSLRRRGKEERCW